MICVFSCLWNAVSILFFFFFPELVNMLKKEEKRVKNRSDGCFSLFTCVRLKKKEEENINSKAKMGTNQTAIIALDLHTKAGNPFVLLMCYYALYFRSKRREKKKKEVTVCA